MFNRNADARLSTYADFMEGVAELAEVPLIEARRQIENNPPNKALFDYISKELKPHYKIGLLSNAAADWLNDLFTPEQLGLFDATALSCEIGFIKPDPITYIAIAELLGVDPQECVFIDDQERYCTGANEVGMASIIYKNFEQCKTDLEQLLSH